MSDVTLQKIDAGNYQTPDGRYKVEKAAPGEWEDRWTVWDNALETHADGRPFQFATMADARAWLAENGVTDAGA
jgi:hypothetical protein